jgi:plasmid maintenance system antidote protein VapI
MAVRLGKCCGKGPEVWLRMQESYKVTDLWHASKKLETEVAKIVTMRA